MKQIESSLKVLCLIIEGKFKAQESMINQAKARFGDKIKSNRMLEKIQNIDELLIILRRNGLLKLDSLDTLQVFKNLLQDDSYDKALAEHRSSLQVSTNSKPFNVYADHRINENLNGKPHFSDNPPKNLIPGGRREKMFRILADGISTSEFLSIARILKFSENDISGFLTRIHSESARTLVMFGRYEENKKELTTDLMLKLLDLINRPDLAKSIRNL